MLVEPISGALPLAGHKPPVQPEIPPHPFQSAREPPRETGTEGVRSRSGVTGDEHRVIKLDLRVSGLVIQSQGRKPAPAALGDALHVMKENVGTAQTVMRRLLFAPLPR